MSAYAWFSLFVLAVCVAGFAGAALEVLRDRRQARR